MFRRVSHENTREYDETRWDSLRTPQKSAFSEQKRPKKGEKVIFKNFQHPMLWGVYPEVLMALAQNS